jgi:histidyl-tRNA synthetase
MKIPAFTFTQALRDKNIKADCDLSGRSLKAQFKYADKIGAWYVALLGGEEYERGVVKIRDMKTKEEKEIPLERAVEEIGEITLTRALQARTAQSSDDKA